jgi:hypothetical protein
MMLSSDTVKRLLDSIKHSRILDVELTLSFTIEVKFETDSVYSGMAYPGSPI